MVFLNIKSWSYIFLIGVFMIVRKLYNEIKNSRLLQKVYFYVLYLMALKKIRWLNIALLRLMSNSYFKCYVRLHALQGYHVTAFQQEMRVFNNARFVRWPYIQNWISIQYILYILPSSVLYITSLTVYSNLK